MFGIKANKRRAGKEEAEKPFWISFSDLMTALMVLFLVAMAVALIAVSQGLIDIDEATKVAKARKEAIEACVADFDALVKDAEFSGISIRGKSIDDRSIDFGTLVRFAHAKHSFQSPSDEIVLRKFVPRILDLARGKKCSKWLKRVVVEGFASNNGGGYLTNLNLSYLRSQRVLCSLLSTKVPDALSREDRELIQTLFLVGGSSFNTAEREESQMRRVELRLEFLGLDQSQHVPLRIELDPGTECPNPSEIR